jgi:hypothetical protein
MDDLARAMLDHRTWHERYQSNDVFLEYKETFPSATVRQIKSLLLAEKLFIPAKNFNWSSVPSAVRAWGVHVNGEDFYLCEFMGTTGNGAASKFHLRHVKGNKQVGEIKQNVTAANALVQGSRFHVLNPIVPVPITLSATAVAAAASQEEVLQVVELAEFPCMEQLQEAFRTSGQTICKPNIIYILKRLEKQFYTWHKCRELAIGVVTAHSYMDVFAVMRDAYIMRYLQPIRSKQEFEVALQAYARNIAWSHKCLHVETKILIGQVQSRLSLNKEFNEIIQDLLEMDDAQFYRLLNLTQCVYISAFYKNTRKGVIDNFNAKSV